MVATRWRRVATRSRSARVSRSGRGRSGRLDHGRAAGQDLCVQRVCLGQLAGGACEIPYLARVSHDDGMAGCAQGHGHLGLQAAGGLHHNLRGRGRHQPGTQLGQPRGIMGHPPHGILTGDGHIQVRLRHIDSHKKLWLGHGMVLRYAWNRLFSGPALRVMRILDPGNCTGSGKTRARRAQGAPGSGSVSLTRTKGPHGLSRPLQPGTAAFSYHTRVPAQRPHRHLRCDLVSAAWPIRPSKRAKGVRRWTQGAARAPARSVPGSRGDATVSVPGERH